MVLIIIFQGTKAATECFEFVSRNLV